MKTFKITLATLALTLFANLSYGQTTVTPTDKANRQTEELAKKYELTAEQKAKVSEINLAIAQKNESVRLDTKLSEETKMQSYQGNKDAGVQMIKAVLTPAQNEKFEADLKAQSERSSKKEYQDQKRISPEMAPASTRKAN